MSDGTIVALGYQEGLSAASLQSNQAIFLQNCPAYVFGESGVSPQGNWGVVVGMDGEVVRLQAGPARCLPTLHGLRAQTADISEDGKTLILGINGAVERRDADGRLKWHTDHPLPSPMDVALSPNERWVAAASPDHNARIYDAETGRLLAVLSGHQERVVSVDFSPDSRQLVTGSWDRTARIWAMEALDQTPQELLQKAENTWGISLEEALQAAAR
jgi:WD40 repeat protein